MPIVIGNSSVPPSVAEPEIAQEMSGASVKDACYLR